MLLKFYIIYSFIWFQNHFSKYTLEVTTFISKVSLISSKPWSSRACILQDPCWGMKSWLCHFWCPCLWFLKMSFSKWSCSHLSYCQLLPLAFPSCWLSWPKAGWEAGLWVLCLGLHQQYSLHHPCLRHRALAEEGGRCWDWGDLPLLKPSGLVCKNMVTFWHCRAQHSDAQTLLQPWAVRDMPELMQQVSSTLQGKDKSDCQPSAPSKAWLCFVPKSIAICIQWNKLHYTCLFLKRTSELLFISIWLPFYVFHLYFFLPAFVLHTLKWMARPHFIKMVAKVTNGTVWPNKGCGTHPEHSGH